MAQAHQRTRNLLATLHVGQQVRAAGKGHRVSPLAVQNASCFFQGARRAKVEKWQAHHGARTFSFSPRCFSRRGTSFTALPSPPSHGGGTRSDSGQFTFGKWSGPKRGSRPALFSAR